MGIRCFDREDSGQRNKWEKLADHIVGSGDQDGRLMEKTKRKLQLMTIINFTVAVIPGGTCWVYCRVEHCTIHLCVISLSFQRGLFERMKTTAASDPALEEEQSKTFWIVTQSENHHNNIQPRADRISLCYSDIEERVTHICKRYVTTFQSYVTCTIRKVYTILVKMNTSLALGFPLEVLRGFTATWFGLIDESAPIRLTITQTIVPG